MSAFIEVQCRQAMLAVDDQELLIRILQLANGLVAILRLETQLLRGKKQYGSGYRRLADRRFIEITNRLDLGARDHSLECFFAPLDPPDKLRHVVLFGYLLRLDFLALVVKSADEPHLAEQLLGGVCREIKHRIFLPNPCCHHITGLMVKSYPIKNVPDDLYSYTRRGAKTSRQRSPKVMGQ